MKTAGQTVATTDLVLVGGGHSHVAVLRHFGMKPLPGLRITVISRELHTPYSGMLPGFVAGFYQSDDIHIDLAPLCAFARARLYHDEVVGLDLAERRVICRGRPPVSYDFLSIDSGSTPALDEVPGAAGHVLPVKPISRFIPQWQDLRTRVLQRPERSRIAFVGAGAGGVELLLAVEARLRRDLHAAGRADARPEMHLFARSEEVLPSFAPAMRHRTDRLLRARGIHVHRHEAAAGIDGRTIATTSGQRFDADEIVWVTSAAAPSWPAAAGLAVDPRGFIQVDATLRSLSHPEVFAAGDVAAVVPHPRPKAGVFAVRQGMPLARNLRRAVSGRTLRAFRPQRKYLAILGDGEGGAIATRGRWAVCGGWVWRWKDAIDRRFMRRYAELPDMAGDAAPPETPEEFAAQAAMRCGGCGAKVGSDILSGALARLAPTLRGDVAIGLAAPDDAAVVAVPPGKLAVHTVDYFRAILDDPYLFGRIAANHSLGDLYAMGASPSSVLAIVTLPYGPDAKTGEMLFQLMAGALRTVEEAGAVLVGGHTSEGAELALGFAVNGVIDPSAILRKAGLRPGDRLLLTKPLGTGTLFAAAMRGKAKARWIDAAVTSMIRSGQPAAARLAAFDASACTDVTGFGLAGHLIEMARPSGVDVQIDLEALPILDGALHTARARILSSLQPQNERAAPAVVNAEDWRGHDRYPLLFDPQTAGGLLVGVPDHQAEACLRSLRQGGDEEACCIGRVLDRGGPGGHIILA